MLDKDSLRRLETNPLRILDNQNQALQPLINEAPELMASLGEDSRHHFQTLTQTLDKLSINYLVNTRLIRGLDYYSKTVFEWVSGDLGAQNTVCTGGRYNRLIAQLGGKSNHAVGFAMGIERLSLLFAQLNNIPIGPCRGCLYAQRRRSSTARRLEIG